MADGTARVGGARFDNLTLTLPEAERYTYTFDGRSQAIDHIIVNDLLSGVATYDVVHLNTGYNALGTGPDASPRLSDHDPGLSSFDFRNFSEVLNGTAGADTIDGFGGNDIIRGGGGDDAIDGGIGTDTASYAGNVADYTIVAQFDGNGNLIGFLSVTDNNTGNGDEGTDTLTSIERLSSPMRRSNCSATRCCCSTATTIWSAPSPPSRPRSTRPRTAIRSWRLPRTYTEDLTVDVDVTIRGANDGIAGNRGRAAPRRSSTAASRSPPAASPSTASRSSANPRHPRPAGSIRASSSSGNGFVLINSVLDGPDGDFILDTVGVLVGGGVTGLDIGHNLHHRLSARRLYRRRQHRGLGPRQSVPGRGPAVQRRGHGQRHQQRNLARADPGEHASTASGRA